ncbi:MAG: TolC family protein [Bacteroidota bacterium]
MIYRFLPTFLAALWLSASALAQQPLDLKSAMRYAAEHHASIQKANIEIAKGKELIRESVSTGLPQVDFRSNLTNNLKLPVSLVPAEFFGGQPGDFAEISFGTNWNANAGVELNQMAYNQSWLLALKATRAVNDFYRLVLDKTKEDVVYEVAKVYYQIQLTHTQRGILQANLNQIKGLLSVTEKQFANGFAKKIDVDRLSVQQSNLSMQIQNLDLQIEQLEDALKFAMNMPLETQITLTDTITETSLKEVDVTLAQPAFQQKTDLLVVKKQIELWDLDVRRYRAGYFPVVSVFANYNYQWQANSLGDLGTGQYWSDFSSAGLRINVPIFDGFYKSSKMQTARLNGLQAQQDYNFTLLGLQLQHQTAVTALRVNQNNLRTVQDTRRVAEDVYRVSQSRFKEGIAPITEVLDAENALRQAQSNYITTLAQIKLAEIDLLNANGLLIKMTE